MKKRYPTDMSDVQWSWIEKYFPPPEKMGRPKTHSPREILDAIAYVDKTGCQWRLLPHDFPKWNLVYHYFSLWSTSGLLNRIHDDVRRATRIQDGREPTPTAAIIDSQSTKATNMPENKGFDAGKKVNGRKKHLLVDTLGLILVCVVHSANIQDRDGARMVFDRISASDSKTLELVWADGGYAGALVEETQLERDFELEIVKRSDDMSGFHVLPRRWVVERTHAWLDSNRRLSKDYERKERSVESFIHVGMLRLMLNRLETA